MTNKEILEKAIQKAIDGGWDGGQFGSLPLDLNRWRFDSGYNAFGIGQYEFEVWVEPCEYIFNHDFAKALWGEELHHETFIVPKELNKRFAGTKNIDVKPAWQYHLQQMVIADDPIKYLGENI